MFCVSDDVKSVSFEADEKQENGCQPGDLVQFEVELALNWSLDDDMDTEDTPAKFDVTIYAGIIKNRSCITS